MARRGHGRGSGAWREGDAGEGVVRGAGRGGVREIDDGAGSEGSEHAAGGPADRRRAQRKTRRGKAPTDRQTDWAQRAKRTTASTHRRRVALPLSCSPLSSLAGRKGESAGGVAREVARWERTRIGAGAKRDNAVPGICDERRASRRGNGRKQGKGDEARRADKKSRRGGVGGQRSALGGGESGEAKKKAWEGREAKTMSHESRQRMDARHVGGGSRG